MPLKYFIDYQDITDVNHRLEIYDELYFPGEAVKVDGEIRLDYSETKELLDPIKGSGLRIDLDASVDLTFEDLYAEYEKDFEVKYYRNYDLVFTGWINPEGWFENYVVDNWVVSFDCVDGLSFLDNLSYVDENKLLYLGKDTFIEIIAKCLFRTGIQQDIRTGVGIKYWGQNVNDDSLALAKVDQARFIKADNVTPMSCREVLESILEIFTAVLVNHNGYWYIYKPNQLFLSPTINYYAYNPDGTEHIVPTGSIDTTFHIGSEINGFYPHHCSANQSITNEKSIGGYRINYKYGKILSLLPNEFLEHDFTNVFFWTIDSNVNIWLDSTMRGVNFDSVYLDTESIKQMTSDAVPLITNEVVNLRLQCINTNFYLPSEQKQETMSYRVWITGVGGDLYFNEITGAWGTSPVSNDFVLGKGINTITEHIQPLTIPQIGNLTVELWTPYSYEGSIPPDPSQKFQIKMQEVALDTVEQNEVEGEFWTLQREHNPNSKLEDMREVFNGDNVSATYKGTIYKFDEIELTQYWYRESKPDFTESQQIIRLMGEETLRLNANTKRVFSGSVYGFFSFLSTVNISGLPGLFLVTKYSYDTKRNIVNAEFKQIFGSELTDIGSYKTEDFGESEPPTIL